MLASSLQAMCCGLVIGGVFGLLKIPAPCPGSLPAVIGVASMFLGQYLVKLF